MRALGRALQAAIAAEQDRFFYWVPVLFGAGIATYFALPTEPTLFPLVVAAAVWVGGALVWRRGLASLVVGGVAVWLALGLLAAKIASDFAAAPVLDREMRSVHLTGWVELVEPRAAGGDRITLRVAKADELTAESTPRRVRVRIPGTDVPLAPGDAVTVRASLLPPAGPALPGAYDFARTAWFSSLGAVGSARSPPSRVSIDEPMPWPLRLWIPVEQLRQRISRRITAALPGETGSIAAALVTGERGGISEATNQAYRDSGIFHILSISGLHMTIFAGAVYFTTRLLLSLFPAIALRFEIKKWAALTGLAGTSAYLMISGGSPAAVRSAVMISIMFVAVLLDRRALALRNVALSALVILLVTPSSLIDVGFQMSFAAVVALISGIEAFRAWRHARIGDEPGQRRGPVSGAMLFLGTITLTTLIATASVAPFAAYYFHKSTQYGILANLVAVPLCNIIVMPAALATLIAMPFGLEAWPLIPMGFGIDAMTLVATRVAALPGAVALVPAISTASFGLMVAGGLWLCLWGTRWRLAGLIAIAAGIVLAPLREAPDVLIGAGGKLVAVRGRDGRLAAVDTGKSTFELGRWLEHDADPRPAAEVGPDPVFRCDAIGCSARVKALSVAVARHPAALADDCRTADLVIWLGDGDVACLPGADGRRAHVLGRRDVQRAGAHVVTIAERRKLPLEPKAVVAGAVTDATAAPEPAPQSRMTIRTVAAWRGDRPWSRVRASERGEDF